VDNNASQTPLPPLPRRSSLSLLLFLPHSKAEEEMGRWEDEAAVVRAPLSHPLLLPLLRCACQPCP
jgi:hypothetical protein